MNRMSNSIPYTHYRTIQSMREQYRMKKNLWNYDQRAASIKHFNSNKIAV